MVSALRNSGKLAIMPARARSLQTGRRELSMRGWVRWTLAVGVAALVTVGPVAFYRYVYVHSKRLREVSPGLVYRSGQMTEGGFKDAIKRWGIRTFINFQDEYPDPDISRDYFGLRTIKESALCRRLGVRYVFLQPDLIPRRQVPEHRPRA